MPYFPPDTLFSTALASVRGDPQHTHEERTNSPPPSSASSSTSPVIADDPIVTFLKQRKGNNKISESDMRQYRAIKRIMERDPPAEGLEGFQGSVDDPFDPPSPYEWLKAVLAGEVYRWEPLRGQDPRCIICDMRCPNPLMKAHFKEMHAAHYRYSLLHFGGTPKLTYHMQTQDMVAMWVYVVCRMEEYGKPFSFAQEVKIGQLLATYDSIGFIRPGDDFDVQHESAFLNEMCVDWFEDAP